MRARAESEAFSEQLKAMSDRLDNVAALKQCDQQIAAMNGCIAELERAKQSKRAAAPGSPGSA
jgi:TolA-binding protein